jgi:hypothetical protein
MGNINFSIFGATTDSSEPWLMITLALIGVLGVAITGFFSYLAQKHAKTSAKHSAEANDAVNHRKPGQDRLFDMVASTRDSVRELSEWKERWDSVPDRFQEPQELVTNFAIIEDRISHLGERLDNSIFTLRGHIDNKVTTLEHKVTEIDDKIKLVDKKIESIKNPEKE